MAEPISIHQRSYDTEVFDDGNGVMRVVGRLVDTKPIGLGLADGEPIVIHDMTIELSVQVPSFEIVAVNPKMDVHPYGECPKILAAYGQLIGVSITRGYGRTVRELFGGPSGCSHMGALLMALGPVAIQASWGLKELHEDPLTKATSEWSETDSQQMSLNENTCHIWASEGAKMHKVKLGQRPVQPTWQIDRVAELEARASQS